MRAVLALVAREMLDSAVMNPLMPKRESTRRVALRLRTLELLLRR